MPPPNGRPTAPYGHMVSIWFYNVPVVPMYAVSTRAVSGCSTLQRLLWSHSWLESRFPWYAAKVCEANKAPGLSHSEVDVEAPGIVRNRVKDQQDRFNLQVDVRSRKLWSFLALWFQITLV